MKMLQDIASLSPIRKMKDDFQQVTWPSHVPPHSAQDSFIFIAQGLINDSQRLHNLHGIKETEKLKIDTELQLNRRQYLRCLPFYPKIAVSNVFVHHEKLKTSAIDPFHVKMCSNTQSVSILYHRQRYRVPYELDLKEFLMSRRDTDKFLCGPIYKAEIPNLLKHQVYQEFADLWISLYEYARGGKMTMEAFVLIWSVLTHEDEQFAPILALQAIEANPENFKHIDPPQVEKYKLHEGSYKESQVRSILDQYHRLPCDYYHKDFNQTAYDQQIKQVKDRLASIVTSNWPCDSISLKTHCSHDDIDAGSASNSISHMLKIWNNNLRLENFISKVGEALNSLNGTTPIQIPHIQSLPVQKELKWSKYEIDFKQKMSESVSEFEEITEEAENIWKNKGSLTKTANEWWSIYEEIINAPNTKHLMNAGMFPQAVPSLVLPEITNQENNPLKCIIGALAIKIVHEQRDKRIAFYESREQFRVAMEREVKEKPHINWNPSERPEWLLFEIEQNLTIRATQVDVANHMMNPTNNNNKHSVMQLNMGEGKTLHITHCILILFSF